MTAIKSKLWLALARATWLIAIVPAIGQLALLLYAVFARFGYPYDLEWNEGGMLLHADRIGAGGLYAEPTVEFIAFPYTPLYPGVIAMFGTVFGISYPVARALSIAAIGAVCAFAVIAIRRDTHRDDHVPGWAGAVLGIGLFAAGYPFCEGWYDIAKPDMFMVAIVVAGLVALRLCARRGTDWRGHRCVAIAATILALAFFVKQTAVFYVAAGGVVLLTLNWRRVPVYVASAGFVGLGGTWLLNRATDGWFWKYIYEVKKDQEFHMPRFWDSFRFILWDAPETHQAPTPFTVATVVICFGLVAVAVSAVAQRKLPRSSTGFLMWTWLFAVSCVVGAVGWAAPWGHFNHYIPAMATGGIAAGAAIPAIVGAFATMPRAPRHLGTAVGAVAALCIAAQLGYHWTQWSPSTYIPKAQDRAAGDCIVHAIHNVDGDVMMPFHPWYPRLAGKRTYTHRMGILDMTSPHRVPVVGLREAIANKQFAAIILDHRGGGHKRRIIGELPGLRQYYDEAGEIPAALRPRVYTGAPTVPRSIFVPKGTDGKPIISALKACGRQPDRR